MKAARNFAIVSLILGLEYYITYYRELVLHEFAAGPLLRGIDAMVFYALGYSWIKLIDAIIESSNPHMERLRKHTNKIFLCLMILSAFIYIFLLDEYYATDLLWEEVTVIISEVILGLAVMAFTAAYIICGFREIPDAFSRKYIIIVSAFVCFNTLWNNTSVMYILWVMPALASVGNWQDWSSEGPLSFVEIGNIVGGAPLRWAFVAAGSLASMMILCEYILAYAYLMKSFSEKGQFFKIFSKEHKKFKTPYMAIIILSAVSIVLCSSGSFIEFVGIASILYAVPVIMMFIVNIRLRIKQPDMQLDFKVPLPNKVYIVYLCFPIVIYGASIFADNWIVGLGLAATSIPAYIFFKKIYRGGRYWKECHEIEKSNQNQAS